ncbi:MAG TPA: biopolymer transporter ExbD [Polyangiaceae bacterium]|jgi:biopolymer transport protein ExbD
MARPSALVVLAFAALLGCTNPSQGSAGATPSATPASAAIPVQLPKAQTGDALPSKVLTVVLGADGSCALDGQPVAGDDAIREMAQAERTKVPELTAVVNADGAVPHARVIHVLDELRMAGITKISFGVQAERPPSGANPWGR